MLACAFSVVRHADAVARHLGEPYGTLVLTISVIVIEVSLMAAIILHGENNPTLARDAMFATLMIVLNGMVGTALLMGALRYWEQEYNLEGARAFLVVIASLAVFSLIMPDLTKTEPDPSIAPLQAGLFAAITILFYAIFLAIQTLRHRAGSASWARPHRCGAARAHSVRKRAHFRWRPHQCAAGHRASPALRGLYRADLQPLVLRKSWP
jgi:Ca2+/H+ antiporter